MKIVVVGGTLDSNFREYSGLSFYEYTEKQKELYVLETISGWSKERNQRFEIVQYYRLSSLTDEQAIKKVFECYGMRDALER